MLLALLACPALALPWWVDDEKTGAALKDELDTLWSGHPIEVIVGPAPDATSGLHYDGEALVLVTPERIWTQPAPDDLATLVLLARSWSTEIAAADSGWVPPAPEPAPEPTPTPLPKMARATIPHRKLQAPDRFDLGVGLRDSYRQSGWFEGPRLVARSSWERFQVEAVAFLASGSWTKVGALDHTLLLLHRETDRVQMPLDTASVGLMAGLGLPSRGRGTGLAFSPFAAGGIEAHRWTVRTLVVTVGSGGKEQVTVELDPTVSSWLLVPAIQGGVELGWGHAASLRLGVSESAGGCLFADVLFGL